MIPYGAAGTSNAKSSGGLDDVLAVVEHEEKTPLSLRNDSRPAGGSSAEMASQPARFQDDRAARRLACRAAAAGSTHGLTPTKAGQNFYECAKRAIEEADEAELAARGAGGTLSGRLRICAPVTFARGALRAAALHVMPRLSIFLSELPRSISMWFLRTATLTLLQRA